MSIEVRSNYQLPIFIALYCKGIVNVELFPDDFDKRIALNTKSIMIIFKFILFQFLFWTCTNIYPFKYFDKLFNANTEHIDLVTHIKGLKRKF